MDTTGFVLTAAGLLTLPLALLLVVLVAGGWRMEPTVRARWASFVMALGWTGFLGVIFDAAWSSPGESPWEGLTLAVMVLPAWAPWLLLRGHPGSPRRMIALVLHVFFGFGAAAQVLIYAVLGMNAQSAEGWIAAVGPILGTMYVALAGSIVAVGSVIQRERRPPMLVPQPG